MHRVILGTPPGLFTDHVNGNQLDNRRENLRVCTPSQNQANKKLSKNNTSGHKGVEHVKKINRWRATIVVNGKRITHGSVIFEGV